MKLYEADVMGDGTIALFDAQGNRVKDQPVYLAADVDARLARHRKFLRRLELKVDLMERAI